MSTSLTAEKRSRYQFCGHKRRARRINERDRPSTIANYLSNQGCTGQFHFALRAPSRGSVKTTNRHDSMYPGRHTARNKGIEVDARASRDLDVRSFCYRQRLPHHDHIFRLGWTPPTDTFHVANTEDPPSRLSLRKICVSRSIRSMQVEHQADKFWSRWRGEYLQNLQVRTRFNRERHGLVVHDIVMLKDEQTPFTSWPFIVTIVSLVSTASLWLTNPRGH